MPIRTTLLRVGRELRNARLRRRISSATLAERASLSRTTLQKVEKGDPSVAMGHYAAVLFSLGLLERLSQLADISGDSVGQELEEENLPKRIRRRGAGN